MKSKLSELVLEMAGVAREMKPELSNEGAAIAAVLKVLDMLNEEHEERMDKLLELAKHNSKGIAELMFPGDKEKQQQIEDAAKGKP